MALIGDLIVKAGIDTGALTKGLTKFQGQINGFGNKIMTAQNAIIGFGAAIGAGLVINGLKDLAVGQMDAIDAASDMASQLGTTTGSLQAMQYAVSLTGSDAETLNAGLAKMTLGLGKVGEDGAKAADAIGRLGLDAEALAVEDPTEAFFQISEAINGYGTASDQAAIAAQIFGAANASLLNSINAGPEQIAALVAEAHELGLVVSDVDAAKIGDAKDQMDKVGYALQGLGNKIIVEVAPYITALAKELVSMAKSGVVSSQVVSGGFNLMLEGVKFVVDAVHFLSFGWNAFAGVVQGIAAGVIASLGLIAKAVDYVFEAVGIGATGAGKYLEELSETYAKSAGDNFTEVGNMFEKPLPSDQITQFQNKIAAGASAAADAMNNLDKVNSKVATGVLNILEDVGKLNTELGAKVANFGKTSDEAGVNKLQEKLNAERESLEAQIGRANGMESGPQRDALHGDIDAKQRAIDETQAQLDIANGYAEQLKALEAKKKLEEEIAGIVKKEEESMKSQAEALTKELMTPTEKYFAELEKVHALFDAGLISDSTFNKATEKLRTEYEKDLADQQPDKQEFKHATALEAGTKEARAAIIAHRFGGLNDPINRLHDTTKKQLDEQQRTNTLLADQKKPAIFVFSG